MNLLQRPLDGAPTAVALVPARGSARRFPVGRYLALPPLGLLLTCAWGTGAGPAPPPRTVAKAVASGDGQTGTVSSPLANALQVVVTEAGVPKPNVQVDWQAAGGGAVDPAGSFTDADGIAGTTWTLGSTAGTQAASASVSGAQGSPVSFTATAVSGPVPLLEMTAVNS